MVLTNTPSTLDKVSLDIVGPFPTTKSLYILTIQDLLIKYSMPFKQATSSEITELIEKFINIEYRAESIDYRLEFEFYKQRDALYNT